MTERTARHTPGPWRGNETPDRDGLVRDGGGHVVAQCFPEYFGVEGAKANARLIAAAPEMTAALKTCLGYLDKQSRKIRAAERSARYEAARLGHGRDAEILDAVLKPVRAALEKAGKDPTANKIIRGRSMDREIGR